MDLHIISHVHNTPHLVSKLDGLAGFHLTDLKVCELSILSLDKCQSRLPLNYSLYDRNIMDLIDKEVQRSEIQSNPRTFSITNSRSLQDNIDHVHRLEGIPTGSTVTVAQISEACSPSPSAVPSRKPSTQDLEKKHMFSSRIDVSRRPCPREDSSGNADTKNRDIIKSLPVVGREKSPPVQLENPEQYVVEFDGPDDPMHPLNWPDKKK